MNNIYRQRTSTILTLLSVIFFGSSLPALAENPVVINQQPGSNNLQTGVTSTPTLTEEVTETPTEQTVAQVIAPGRTTRSVPSYIGIGGNIGISGDTTINEGAFAVISKIGLTQNFSVRPSALIGDNTVFLIPVTIDFPQAGAGVGTNQVSIAPYIGGGVAVSTGQDSTVGALISGGVDVPLSQQITATAGVNVGFIDETDVGLLLGVGYNF
jgi:hypothetical protein